MTVHDLEVTYPGLGKCRFTGQPPSRDFRLAAEVSQALGWAIALCGRTSLYNAAP
jgi:hypothetical protein